MNRVIAAQPSPFRKGDRVKDRDGHTGIVEAIYNAQNKAKVRWHKGFATEESFGDLVAL